MRTDFMKLNVAEPTISFRNNKKSLNDLIAELYTDDAAEPLEEVADSKEPMSERERQMIDQLVDKVLEA